MEYRILGPLVVAAKANLCRSAGGGIRSCFACFFCAPIRSCPATAWSRISGRSGARQPAQAVQVYVMRRKTLGVDVLATRAQGYVLRVDEGQLDAWRFEQLVAQGREAQAAGDPARAATLLRRALAGADALADVMGAVRSGRGGSTGEASPLLR